MLGAKDKLYAVEEILMDVKIVATKSCSHCLGLQHELRDIGIPFQIIFIEEHPNFARTHGIRHSSNLLVKDEVIFRGQPTPHELRAYFTKACGTGS